MADEADLAKTLAALKRLLRRARAPYAVIGAIALAAWGRPRATQDLDLLVGLDPGVGAERLREIGPSLGLAVDREWADWNPALRDLQVRLRRGTFVIDLLLPRDAHDRKALARRRRRRLQDAPLLVIAPEDYVLQQLKVMRGRSLEDAAAVLAERGRGFDLGYTRRWASRLGVRAELEYLLRHVDERRR